MRRVSEEEVRERLRNRYGWPDQCLCEFCQFLDGPGLGDATKAMGRIRSELCPTVGVRWTGTHYEEVWE